MKNLKNKILSIFFIVLTVVLLIYTVISIINSYVRYKNGLISFVIFSFFTISTIILAISCFCLILLIIIKEKEREFGYKIYTNIRESVRGSVDSNKILNDQTSDILELMLANMKEINDYYVLSKSQARNSFLFAVIMSITGVLLIAFSIFASFSGDEKNLSMVIPAISAAMVELIAGTALLVYKKSLEQLNRYYNSLHNNERFLSIVNLVSKVSQEKQDEIYLEIIKSQMGILSKKTEFDNEVNN